jgi:predicted transcriptional regulator
VSRETGIPESTVRNSLRLLEAPQPAQEAVNTGYISQTDLFEIEKLSEEQQKELLKKIEERKLENKDREKIKSRAATSIPLIRSDYKDIVIEWIDSGKDLLEIKMIEKLKPDFAKLIKVKFDERFIPFYNALKEKAK